MKKEKKKKKKKKREEVEVEVEVEVVEERRRRSWLPPPPDAATNSTPPQILLIFEEKLNHENSGSRKRGAFGSFPKNFSGSREMVQFHWDLPKKKVTERTNIKNNQQQSVLQDL